MKQVYKLLGTFVIIASGAFYANAQNVGIGTTSPMEKLEVNGAIKIGNTGNTAPGTIRWNESKNDFEGYNGTGWVSLTGGKSQWGSQQSYSTENFATQLYLFSHSNGTYGKELGGAIAATDDWLVAGAFRDAHPSDETKWDIGSIRILSRSGDNWIPRFNIMSPDGNTNDFFGISVGISPTHIIAGAINADIPNQADAGKAYIFSYDNNTVVRQDTLVASDAQANDAFGRSVAIYGNYAAVGAPYNDVGGVANMGRAYVFQRNGTQWPQMSMITPPDGDAGSTFGYSIALWSDYLVVGAPYKNINGENYAGKVYVYRQSGAGWGLIAQLTSPDPGFGEQFGKGLSINNNLLVIGAPDAVGNPNDGTGKVYVYTINNNTVAYQSALMASDGQVGDKFGESVSLKDDVILVGAPNASLGAIYNHGKAYPFKYQNGQWTEQAVLTSGTNAMYDQFGTSVALTSGFGIAGAPFADLPYKTDNGRLFFFKR